MHWMKETHCGVILIVKQSLNLSSASTSNQNKISISSIWFKDKRAGKIWKIPTKIEDGFVKLRDAYPKAVSEF